MEELARPWSELTVAVTMSETVATGAPGCLMVAVGLVFRGWRPPGWGRACRDDGEFVRC